MTHPEEQGFVGFADADGWRLGWMAAAFDAAPIAMAVVGADGTLFKVNAQLCGAVGVSALELMHRSFVELIAREDQEVLREELHKVLLGQKPRAALLASVQCPGGTRFAARISATRMAQGDDLWLVVTVDRCEDWAAREPGVGDQLELQRRRWQEAEQARDRFLSIACHELKTPISALQLQVQSLLRVERGRLHVGDVAPLRALPLATFGLGDERSTLEPRIVTLKRTLDRLTQLIDNLLDISRLRLGKLTLDEEEVDLVELVRDVTMRTSDELLRAGCTVRVHAEGAIIGRWDRLRLEQVVTNLVVNACKYGRGAAIHMRVDSDGEQARFIIQDHGIGIAPQDLHRIFEPFERAVTASQFHGYGLGLWIVRQFIHAMGGHIRVQSQLGTGSTFIAELPLRRPTRDPEQLQH